MKVRIEFLNGFQVVEFRIGWDGTDSHVHNGTKAEEYELFEHDVFSVSYARILFWAHKKACLGYLVLTLATFLRRFEQTFILAANAFLYTPK